MALETPEMDRSVLSFDFQKKIGQKYENFKIVGSCEHFSKNPEFLKIENPKNRKEPLLNKKTTRRLTCTRDGSQ